MIILLAQSWALGLSNQLDHSTGVTPGRLYADEADRLLDLFQEWLGATGRASVRRDGYRTGSGQVYEFFGSEPSSNGELERQFADFSSFLDLCVTDATAANTRLKEVGVTPDRAATMTSRYAREARRLSLDLRHAREDRILQLSHSFENDVLNEGDMDWKPVLERLIPAAGDIVQVLAPQATANSINPQQASTVNVTNQIFTGNVSHVVQSVQGTVHLNPDAKHILEIIGLHGGASISELSSAVHELEDEDARVTDRVTARQKLRAFLVGVASEVPVMSLQTLHKYLEHRIGLG